MKKRSMRKRDTALSKVIREFLKLVKHLIPPTEEVPDGEPDLVNAVYRYIRHSWNKGEEKNGADLLHEAFSLNKVCAAVSFSREERCAMICALFQNKKTFIASGVNQVYLAGGYTTVFVCSNAKQAIQTARRLEGDMQATREFLAERGFGEEEYACLRVLYQDSRTRNRDAIKAQQESAMCGDNAACVVLFKEHTQLSHLREAIGEDAEIILFIDEAHKNAGYKNLTDDPAEQIDTDVKWDREIYALRKETPQVKKIIGITATPSNVFLMESELYCDSVFQKGINPGYVGHESLTIHTDMPKPTDAPAVQAQVVEILKDLSVAPLVPRYHDKLREQDDIPHIVLCHVFRGLEEMKGMFTAFRIDNGMMPRDCRGVLA
jgi:hypothetical protein